MIPASHIQAWSLHAPWPDSRQIEQDLVISRALCDLFNAPALRGGIAFRGGTAINKLLFARPLRYSEDIPGEPWKLTDSVLEQLRQERFPGLLRSEDQGKSEPT